MDNRGNILFFINEIAKTLIAEKVDFKVFEKNPEEYLVKYNIDFNIENNNKFILLSQFLKIANPSVKHLMLQNLKSCIDNIKLSEKLDKDLEDSWIEEISGGIPIPGVVAFANVVAAANAAIVANVGALANAAANANAIANANISVSINVMSRSSGVAAAAGISALAVERTGFNRNKISVDKNAITDKLQFSLKENGLNSYRQTALLRYLIDKNISKIDKNAELIKLIVNHENMAINMELIFKNNILQLKRAGMENNQL